MIEKTIDWNEKVLRIKEHLRNVIRQAKNNPGSTHRLELDGDLWLDVIIDKSNTHLHISHQSKFPPMAILWAILKIWPAQVYWPNLLIIQQNDRKYLNAKWATVVSTGDLEQQRPPHMKL